MKFSVFYASTFFAFCSSGETFNSTLHRLEGNEKPGSCVLPNATDDDKSYVANCDQNFPVKPGERVPEGIALWFVCNHGYGRDKGGDRFRSVCSNGSWLPPMQPCLKKCGKPTVLEGIKYKCYNDNQEIECNGEYLTGTKLRASCSLPHHHPNHMEIICDVYGKWNIKNIKCVADCGIYLDEAKRLYKNTYMPWHVLINRHAFGNSTSTMVSGTLIAPNLVISADTIFTNQAALPLPAELFEVIINIFISPAHRKSLKVKHILLPPGYINTKKHLFNKDSGSLVLLYLAEKVELSATVMPICVDWNNTHILPKQSPLTGKMLEVSDLEGNETTQNEAYLVNLTLGSSETCNSMRDLQHDQFCLQSQQKFHFRESLKALEFTTGGGYYVESLEDHLYYIVGVNIVQLFIRDTNQNERTSIFTNITTHIEWLNTIYKGIDAVDDNETIEYHDCGKYSDDAKNLYQGKYSPWHVLVESSFYGAIHSGTLVAPNLVLTGAKIAVFPNNDTVFAKYFKVIVNGFLDERQQKTYEVKEVYRLPGFSHGIPLKEQSDDIAVLHLAQDVTISSVVQPVCLDWTGVNLAPTFLPITGKMIHTGDRTTPALLHNETQIVNMKFLDAEFCKWWTGTSNLGYDRFCARGKGLGDNDMGGGYYVESPKDGLFYIRGISVLLHSNEGVVVYTDVTTHMEWLNMINKKVNGNDKRNLKPPISSSRNLHRSLSDFNCDNDESNRCYLVPQYNIVVTEVICAKANEKCLIHSSSDDKTALSETKIRYKCKNGYFPDGPIDANTITTNLTTVCQNNKWFPPIPQCHLYTTISQKSNVYWKNRTIWTSPVFASECGKPSNAMLLIWNGNTAKPGEFPWHAAIYESEGEEKRQPFCGATIISSRYLLSAAHCFADEENEMTMRNSSLFQVVVGIIKSHHDSKEDFKRHYEIKDIITRSYGGTKYRYQNDLAIIMTKNEIIFNSNVSPICLINNFFPYIPENTELWVAGFGFFNSSEIQSENLMSLEVPFISYEECFGNPNYSELSTFLTPGKFCTTRKKGMGKSIDAGDSGGGLVAKGPNDTYFLVGVISLTVKESPVVLCTYVPQFHRWISEIILDQPIS